MMKIDPTYISNEVSRALAEDIGTGDVTAGLLPSYLPVRAEIISREPMLVCGQPWVNEVFKQLNSEIKMDWKCKEGEWLSSGAVLCQIRGEAQNILSGERTALNFLQTLSATATQTYEYVSRLKGTSTRLLDTRKTIPGLRVAQKYAVSCGGGMNHRMGLYDAFLIKENHIKACGSVSNAIGIARKTHHKLLVEIEVETLAELNEALEAKPDRILLDNFTPEMLLHAVQMNQPKVCALEASGGITLQNIKDIAATGVDYISVGAITKSIKAIDLSLLIRELI